MMGMREPGIEPDGLLIGSQGFFIEPEFEEGIALAKYAKVSLG
jgi:hypothetical protein